MTKNQVSRGQSLKRSTVCIICAIQENAISTKHTKKHIHKTIEDDTSRVCKKKKKDETTQHIISGYSVLATTKYIERHDKIHAYLSSKEL